MKVYFLVLMLLFVPVVIVLLYKIYVNLKKIGCDPPEPFTSRNASKMLSMCKETMHHGKYPDLNYLYYGFYFVILLFATMLMVFTAL